MFSGEDVRKQLSLLGYRDVPEEILAKFVDRLRSAQALHAQQDNEAVNESQDFSNENQQASSLPQTHSPSAVFGNLQDNRPEAKHQPKRKKIKKKSTKAASPYVANRSRSARSAKKSRKQANISINNENESRHPNIAQDDAQDQRREQQRRQLAMALAEKKRLLKQLHSRNNRPSKEEEVETDQQEEREPRDDYSNQESGSEAEEQAELKAVVNVLPVSKRVKPSPSPNRYNLRSSSSNAALNTSRPRTARSSTLSRSASTVSGLRSRPMTARRKRAPGQLARKSDPVSRFHQYNAQWKKNSRLTRRA